MMTKESFLKLVKKLGGSKVAQGTVKIREEEVEYILVSLGLSPDEYADIIADALNDQSFDAFCNHPPPDDNSADPVGIFQERAVHWSEERISVLFCFIDKGWRSVKFYERDGILRLTEEKYLSSNCQDSFSCMIESLPYQSSGYFHYDISPGNENKGEGDIELIITHNPEYLIINN